MRPYRYGYKSRGCESPLTAIPEPVLVEIAKVFKDKLSRDIKLNPKVDPKVVGGVILMFESLQLDGSLQNALKESSQRSKDSRWRNRAIPNTIRSY